MVLLQPIALVNSEMNVNLAGIVGLGLEGEILKIGASNA